MRLLGITGRVLTKSGKFVGTAGAGKDEVAQHLSTMHGYVQYALATPIKRMLAALPNMELYKWADRFWKDRDPHPLFGVTRRHMARTLGTEWRNTICEDMWLRLAKHAFDQHAQEQPCPTGMVISDIRFQHEVDWLRANGGELVIVIRDNGLDTEQPEHASEAGVRTELSDHKIYNTGTLVDLYAAVDGVMDVVHEC
jgi:hypothetical protein